MSYTGAPTSALSRPAAGLAIRRTAQKDAQEDAPPETAIPVPHVRASQTRIVVGAGGSICIV